MTSPTKEKIRTSITRSLTGPGNVHTTLCAKFTRAGSWQELWNAVRSSPLNCGADELVHLSLRRDGCNPPNITAVKSIVFNNIASLGHLLSFVELAKPASSAVDSNAKSFIPQAGGTAPPSTEEEVIDPVTVEGERNNSGFPDLMASDDDITLIPGESQPSLAASDIELGKKILFCFRRYTLRHRTKMRRAVKIIWACYLQYRFRYKAPMTAAETEIRRFHSEYKNDTESIGITSSCTRAFRKHKHILLGLMPHVLLYLSGLESVNQQQKQVIQKELQKVQHGEFTRAVKRMGACTALAKKIKASIQRISPGSSTLYLIDSLREEAEQVDSLRSEVMRTFGKEVISKVLEEHYNLGVSVMLSTFSNSIVKPIQTRT